MSQHKKDVKQKFTLQTRVAFFVLFLDIMLLARGMVCFVHVSNLVEKVENWRFCLKKLVLGLFLAPI